jgi:hypothetical protein
MITRVAALTVAVLCSFTALASADTAIKSEDGTLELTVPNGWRQTKAAATAIQLQVTDGRATFLVRAVSKEDFRDLQAFAQRGSARFTKEITDAEPKFEDVQINGKPAIRVSILGTQANGTRRGYVMTFLEADGMFINTVGIANASAFKASQQTLADMAGRVKVIKSASTTSTAAPSPAEAAPPAGTPTTPAPGRQPARGSR